MAPGSRDDYGFARYFVAPINKFAEMSCPRKLAVDSGQREKS